MGYRGHLGPCIFIHLNAYSCQFISQTYPGKAAVDGAKFPEIAGTVAGDDTVLIITPSKKSRESLQKKIEALVK